MTPRARFATAVAALLLAARLSAAQCAPATQRLIDERRFDEARAVLVKSPNDDQALHCLGMISVATDRDREAIDYFERAVKLNDRSSSHHLWLGNALGDMADSTSKFKLPFLARRVKSEFERAVALDPRSVDARHGLIQFYIQAPGVMGGSTDKAIEQVHEIAKINPMRGHFEMANILAREKKTAELERELVTADKEFPDSSAAALALANFYQNQRRWPDAFAIFDRVEKKFPSEASVHYSIGRTAAVSGEQLERGEKEMKIWLGSPPKDATSINLSNGHWRLGNIYEKQGKKDLARAEYTAALGLFPGNANAKNSLELLK
jgi:tetratricopeptide (TPR) repeat protein